MSAQPTKENIWFYRHLMSEKMESTNFLLEQLKQEAEKLDGHDKIIFIQRIQVFEKFVNSVVHYDEIVHRYMQQNPDAGNLQYYRDKLAVARKYVGSLGGDWQTVEWGKLSDYQ